MKVPLHITFRHIESSPAVEARIRDEADGLDAAYHSITSCRVIVEAPAPQQHHGQIFHIRIFMAVPGKEIAVNHQASKHSTLVQEGAREVEKSQEPGGEHKDIYVAISDAFAAARRQLEDYVRVRRGEVKNNAAVSAAGVEQLTQ
jgi:ribosome-associated translation inhibitor RaiA